MKRLLMLIIGIILFSISCRNQNTGQITQIISNTHTPIKTPSPSTTNTSTLTSMQVRRLTAVAYTPFPTSSPDGQDYFSYVDTAEAIQTSTESVIQTARATFLNITPIVTGTSIYLSSNATQMVEWSIRDTQQASITQSATPDLSASPTPRCKPNDEDCIYSVEKNFYETFRANLIEGNRRAVAEAITFPRTAVIDGRYKVIENEDEFLLYYDQIITEKVINGVTENPFDISMKMGSRGWMVEAGTIWFTTYYIDYPNSYETYGKVTGLSNGIFPDDSITTQTPSPLMSDQDLYGKWVVVDILDSAKKGEWYPFPNRDLYMGEVVTIEPGQITLLDQTCIFNSFYHRSVIAEDYFYIIHNTSAFPLGIMNQVYIEVVETGCAGVPLWNIIVQNPEIIFIPMEESWSVHYLELERVQ